MDTDKKLYRRTILSVKSIIKDSVLEISIVKTKNFIAGQVVSISSDLKIPARLYSIASGTHEEEVRILFDVVPDGILTRKLAKLKTGDSIFVSDAFGTFVCDNSPAYWIASGTGIAPFASMFFSGLAKNKILIHGGRRLNSFYFANNFAPSMGENYIRCCSQEKGRDVFEGRLTDYLRQCHNFPTDYKYYLCGSAEMVVETRDILIGKGVSFDKIIAEIYF